MQLPLLPPKGSCTLPLSANTATHPSFQSFTGYISKRLRKVTLLLALLAGLSIPSAYAVQGDNFSHDPSSLIKDGNTYWSFYTADGIGAKYSTDLVKWTKGTSPYTKDVWPSWIKTYAPTFSGTFWAPECIYMNGLYHLYYACAGGTETIGLATSPSLNNPTWTDRGMVVYANSSNDYFAIDPDVFFDASGRLWMSFGSWKSGIKMVELNKTTGKRLNTTMFSPCTLFDAENSQVVRNGSYYYMFVNRGECCKDANSTYYVQVGRSTSVTGPYTDWRTVLSTNGSFIGPGAIGYFSEGGVEYATMHYYDGDNTAWKGAPTFAIGRFSWSGGWPSINLNWLNNGTYRLTNVNSGLVWDDWGCTGATTEPIAQGTWNNLLCQKWNFTHLGNGNYKITCSQGGLSADASGCKPDNSTPIGLYAYWGGTCQIWHIERTNTGSYVIASKNGNRVVEVPGARTNPGQPLALWDYNGNNCQKWTVGTASARVAALSDEATELQLSPNPSAAGKFTLALGQAQPGSDVSVQVLSLPGVVVYQQAYAAQATLSVDAALKPGLYVVQVRNNGRLFTQKLVVE